MQDAERQEFLRVTLELFEKKHSQRDGREKSAHPMQNLPIRDDRRVDRKSKLHVILEGLQRLHDMQEQIEELRNQDRNDDCAALISAHTELRTVMRQACASAGLGRIIKALGNNVSSRHDGSMNDKKFPSEDA